MAIFLHQNPVFQRPARRHQLALRQVSMSLNKLNPLLTDETTDPLGFYDLSAGSPMVSLYASFPFYHMLSEAFSHPLRSGCLLVPLDSTV